MTKLQLLRTLDQFTLAYLACALWSSCSYDQEGNNGTPIEQDYTETDITVRSLRSMMADCKVFQAHNADLLAQAGTDEQNGHDFWLTRNCHGAGYWDRGYPKTVGQLLTAESHAYGESDLYVWRKRVYLYGA